MPVSYTHLDVYKRQPQTWASYAGMSYNIGAICGYIGLGFFADNFGRKPVVMIFFAASLVLTPLLYLWTHDLYLCLLYTSRCV